MRKCVAITVLVLTILFTGCQNIQKPKKPKNLIPEDKMVQVLVDMLKTSSAQSYSNYEYNRRGVNAKQLVFEKYGIDSTQLKKSTAYYASLFKINQRIYDSVRVQLKREDEKFDSIRDNREKNDFKRHHPKEKSRDFKVKN